MSNRIQSKAFNKKKKKRFVWSIILVFVVLISWSISIFYFTILPGLNIVNIKIFGADDDITGSLEANAMNSISGNYLNIFPKSNIFIYPKGEIINKIKNASPRIDNVSVNREGYKTLNISVSQKIPVAMACNGLPDWQDGKLIIPDDDKCYYVDQNGFVFQNISNKSNQDYNIFFVDNIDIGSYVASTTKFVLLQSIFSKTMNVGIPSSAMLIKDGGDYELYASTTIIYFNDVADINKEIENLILFWNRVKNDAVRNNKTVIFSDIKLQYPPNVYYTEEK